ncbi:MAG: WbqC family protein [Pirellulales bacterium]|nr:WbqC family protein [Pirellulales bacterium]
MSHHSRELAITTCEPSTGGNSATSPCAPPACHPTPVASRHTCVILQPSYIPWRGYFHQIQKADTFVFYDDVQYDKHGWRNRNLIKTAQGLLWLTIPVSAKGAVSQGRLINQIPIVWDRNWARQHWETLKAAYSKAPFFQRYSDLLAPFYHRRDALLADFTIDLTIALARELGIRGTRFLRSSQLGIPGTKTERLIKILQKVGATHYVSGPSARDYLDEAALARASITLEYMDYHYSEYPQLYEPFARQVSILDLLLMLGPAAGEAIWGESVPAEAKSSGYAAAA